MRGFIKNKKIYITLALLCFFRFAFSTDFYWEAPIVVSDLNARFPSVLTLTEDDSAVLFFEEIDSAKRLIWIRAQRISLENYETSLSRRIAGPFSYSGKIPEIYSVALSKNGMICVSVATSDFSIAVYASDDGGISFSENSRLAERGFSAAATKIFSTFDGGFVLFAVSDKNESFSLFYSLSDDGKNWSSFEAFGPSLSLKNSFSPYLCSLEGRDIVVFQAQYQYSPNADEKSRKSYQIFSCSSADGMKSWSDVTLLTNQSDSSDASVASSSFDKYNNQHPVLFFDGKKKYIAWEKSYYTSSTAAIWFSELSDDATFMSAPERISFSGNACRPQFFEFGGSVSIAWFDNRYGFDCVYMAQKNGYLWQKSRLNSSNRASSYVCPIVSRDGKYLSFVWQQQVERKSFPKIVLLGADNSVQEAKINPEGFEDGQKGSARKISAQIDIPSDTSGIAGFSWIFTENADDEVPNVITNYPDENMIFASAENDGTYYLKVKVADSAGNWSKTSSVSYTFDKTPPEKPSVKLDDVDSSGFMRSNTFSIEWNQGFSDEDEDISGYTWSFEKIASFDSAKGKTKQSLLDQYALQIKNAADPPSYNMGNKKSVSFKNYRNGLYVFSVCAIDKAGNISEKSSTPILLNKYMPSTSISELDVKINGNGTVFLSVKGSDFDYGGTVTEILIEKNSELYPRSKSLFSENGDFEVVSNSLISGIKLNDLDFGEYSVYLKHSARGFYPPPESSKKILNKFIITESGTIKFEKPYYSTAEWGSSSEIKIRDGQSFNILFVSLLILAVIVAFACAFCFISAIKEETVIKHEVQRLLKGEIKNDEIKKKAAEIKNRGIGLKLKLAVFTAILVLVIVVMVSLSFEINMTKVQERTLARALEDRVSVLLESVSSGVKSYMPYGLNNIIELNYLPAQSDSFAEADYITISGLSASESNTNLDYVWASNDPDILLKIDSEQWSYGESRLIEKDESEIALKCHELEPIAEEITNDLILKLSELYDEYLSLSNSTNQNAKNRKNEINDEIRSLNVRITGVLNEISIRGSGSLPAFNNNKLDKTQTDYLFYKPVLYRSASEKNLVHAVVFMRVSTEELIAEVDSSRDSIIFTSVVVALIAIILGIAGSYILASIIVRPIIRLVKHVNKITEIKDQKRLKEINIEINTRDEIGTLGEALNFMIHGLGRAAEESQRSVEKEKMALDGKSVQQAFLPLMQTHSGAKKTFAEFNDKNAKFFGYYEGADSVSGDYFDYKKIDENRYAIIKCDASGHGVPAALIMTVVATMFRKYFVNWKEETHGTSIDKLVVEINDFIESLGVKGKFAALIVCLLDTKTGEVFMCNAGDNIVHIFDSNDKTLKSIKLHESPAAGPLPSFMIDSKGGFKVEKINLKNNDILLLYTDGIVESSRIIRNERFEAENYSGENDFIPSAIKWSEQFEEGRIKAIVEAVMTKGKFKLEKSRNPDSFEDLTFDFSNCEGSISEAVLALASAEKVFRMYKPPFASASVITDANGNISIQGDFVKVDKKIDDFLKKTFNRYKYYCSEKANLEELNYIYYMNVNEDVQADDLTLLAVETMR